MTDPTLFPGEARSAAQIRSVPKERRRAPDGLVVREQRAYAKGKLKFLSDFVPPALSISRTKRHRYYLELFAGSGLNYDKKTAEIFDGSALRIAQLAAPPGCRHFTHAYFFNRDREDHVALQARLDGVRSAGRLAVEDFSAIEGDCNASLPSVLQVMHPRSYLFVFADLEGIAQLPWTTVERLRARHKSVDLYVLLPTYLALNRLLGTNRAHRDKNAPAITTWYGHERWRPIVDRWDTAAAAPSVRRELEQLYIEGLVSHWPFVERVTVAYLAPNRPLYTMLLATGHSAAKRVARWGAENSSGQIPLGLDT